MSRKESWKKELGLSEYPWSSDDDDDDDFSTRGSPQPLEPPAPRSRLNGTSDPTLASSSRKVSTSTHSQGPSRATTKALVKRIGDHSLSAINRPKSSSSAPSANGPSTSRKASQPAGASSSSAIKKAQDKKDRDSFWSAINGPNRFAAMASLSRSRENSSRVHSAGPSRSTSTQSLSRSTLATPSTSFSRSLTQPTHASLSSSALPGGSGRHTDLQKLIETRNMMLNRYLEATKKSTANLVSISRILLKAKRKSRTRNTSSISRTEDRSRLYRVPGTGSAVPPAAPAARAAPALAGGIEHSDDDLRLPAFSFDEIGGHIDVQEIQREVTDAPAVALEEEIVEIETEAETSLGTEAETSTEMIDTAGTSSSAQIINPPNGTDDGTSQVHGVKRKLHSDDDVESSLVEVANKPNEANEATSQTQGVKRKRDAAFGSPSESAQTNTNAADGDEEQSIKEFNQSLLKLLECPVCLESMAPPLAQCRRGHLVCGRCRARLAACPVCRAAFSSVRNRAMEGVADMVWYPCRHACGRELRLRARAAHEGCCAARRHRCPAPGCARALRRRELAAHAQSKHLSMMKLGRTHDLSLQLNAEERRNFLVFVYGEIFHLKLDVDVRTWGLMLYVTYMGPLNEASNYTYQVVVTGQYNSRKLVYTRETHCDLESSALNTSRQDCFHMSLDQAINFHRVRNKPCEPNQTLNLTVEILKNENPPRDEVKISDIQ